MPAKNSVKVYIENGYYHLYNRGVEKRLIFLDRQDYAVFLSYLKKYLNPSLGSDPKSLAQEIDLIAFCLMPNHFHLQVRQKTRNGITKLIRAVCTSYVMYFNNKYDRVGTLFQGKYKAALIEKESYLLHLSRYIHLNPKSHPRLYPYSSYSYYLGNKHANWIKPNEILAFFKTSQKTHLKDCFSYQDFIEDYIEDPSAVLGSLILED
jgi:putative transposase